MYLKPFITYLIIRRIRSFPFLYCIYNELYLRLRCMSTVEKFYLLLAFAQLVLVFGMNVLICIIFIFTVILPLALHRKWNRSTELISGGNEYRIIFSVSILFTIRYCTSYFNCIISMILQMFYFILLKLSHSCYRFTIFFFFLSTDCTYYFHSSVISSEWKKH